MPYYQHYDCLKMRVFISVLAVVIVFDILTADVSQRGAVQLLQGDGDDRERPAEHSSHRYMPQLKRLLQPHRVIGAGELQVQVVLHGRRRSPRGRRHRQHP